VDRFVCRWCQFQTESVLRQRTCRVMIDCCNSGVGSRPPNGVAPRGSIPSSSVDQGRPSEQTVSRLVDMFPQWDLEAGVRG
jgi:hypothetical protein